ncbi:MAG: OmpA family protein [Acidobacteriia bacterium]|nr:OmpA family protein [Terriglobia bacterium]
MKKTLGLSVILIGGLLSGGCATKKYVQQTTSPIQTKVDQVSDQSNKQGTSIEEARKDIERHETGINAAKERAMSAEKAASDAMNAAKTADSTANEAKSLANQNTQQISSIQQTLGNLDDYKMAAETVVPFGFNKDTLSPEAKQQLDQFVQEHSNSKRFFITIEGFTDKTGSSAYNDALSRRRAERVMAYMVTQHNIPVFRIQDVGLGKEKPADEGRNREARAKNRRVEIRMFTADLAGTQAANSPAAPTQATR